MKKTIYLLMTYSYMQKIQKCLPKSLEWVNKFGKFIKYKINNLLQSYINQDNVVLVWS